MTRPKILVIDDEPEIREILTELLGLEGYEVFSAADGRSGIEIFEKHNPAVVITDISMPIMTGFEVLKVIHEKSPKTGVILITGNGEATVAVSALRDGAFDFFDKPVDFDRLTVAVKRKLDLQRFDLDKGQLQVQLFQTMKLASIGTLASGVGYELNSPLAVVVAYVEQVREVLDEAPIDVKTRDELVSTLSLVKKAAARMQATIKHLLAYSRQADAFDFSDVQIRDPIDKAFLFFSSSYQKFRIADSFVLPRDLPPIYADVGKIEAVFVNLFSYSRKAFEAITDNREKCVTITGSLGREGFIVLVYKDNACGMSAQVCRQLFEPLSSVNDEGKGVESGMPVVATIIEAHKGTISVSSEPGAGAEFTITLPVYKEATDQKSAVRSNA